MPHADTGSLGTPLRRLVLMCALAVGLGFAGGVAALVLVRLIALLTNLTLLHRIGWTLPSLAHLPPSPWTVVAAMAGGLVVAVIATWCPMIRGHGIPEAMEAVLAKHSRISPRAAVAKPLSTAVAIGTGGPFGAEGPIIVTGGALGSLAGQVLSMSPAERKILLACGAAAGMAGIFGTPLAAVILVTELLLFEFSTRAFVPLAIAASVATGMHAWLFGSEPLFTVPPHAYDGLAKLPFYALVGLVCGALAVVIAKGLFLVEAAFRRAPIRAFWHPMIGGAAFAVIGLFVPRVLGVGYDSIGDILAGKLALSTLIAVAIGKLIAWWVALGSGTSGGTLAPILMIGGAVGGILGFGAQHAVPGVGLTPGTVAVVAMAATFGAATGAPFGSIVFLFELTGDYHSILPLMITTVIALIVARALLRDTLMTEKLSRRGMRVGNHMEVDPLRTLRVGEVMTTPAQTIAASATSEEVRTRFATGPHGAYPLVDERGRLAGIVARGDLLEDASLEDSPPPSTRSDVVTVSADDSVLSALDLIVDERVEHLPVVECGRVIGICTRTDILRARARQLEHERPQPGWRQARGAHDTSDREE